MSLTDTAEAGKRATRQAALPTETSPPQLPAPPAQPAAAAAAPNPPEKPEHVVRPLIPGRIVLSHAADGAIGNIWTATVADGTEWDDVLDPIFLSATAMQMKTGDTVRILHDCWKYYGELLVQLPFVVGFGNQANRLRVIPIRFLQCQPPTRAINPHDLHIMHMGAHLKWCLMRAGDPNPVRFGFETQADAERERRNASNARNTPAKV